MKAYQLLEEHFRHIAQLEQISHILHWDTVVVMPEGGGRLREGQTSLIKTLVHERLTNPSVEGWIGEAESDAGALSPWQQANLFRMKHDWLHATAVGADLVEAYARLSLKCELRWQEARKANDFASVAPMLEELVGLCRQMGQAKGEKLGCDPYDALLDSFDAGQRTDEIDRIFATLEKELPTLIQEVTEKQKSQKLVTPTAPVSQDKQKKLGLLCMVALGFNFKEGRLDESVHPFCGGFPGDVRITTRYNESDVSESLMGIIHETGHALYEQGLPKDFADQPVGRAASMSVHESQSLFMEMQISRSPSFLTFIAPHMEDILGLPSEVVAEDNIRRWYHQVKPGLIRVDADEVTYPMHVILRYRMEQKLIAGELAVKDLPDAWRESMQRYLGITPPDDKDGCMQDVHWYCGALGYFPTYTLGAMMAAQFFDAMTKAVPDAHTMIAKGQFDPIVAWQRENIHSKGSLYTSSKLLEHVTGKPLDADLFLNHLKGRYL